MRFHQGVHSRPEQLFKQMLSEPPSRIGVDTETVSLSIRKLLGIGIAVSGRDAFFLSADDPDFVRVIRLLQEPSITKVYHNAPFDLRVLRKWQPDLYNIEDTAILARLAGVPAELEYASYWVGRQTEPAKALMARFKARNMDEVPIAELAKKCCKDAQATLLLLDYLKPKVSQDYYRVERRMLPVLELASRVGVALDQDYRAELERLYSYEFQYYKALTDELGYNPNSPQQVGYMLAKRGVVLPMSKSGRQLATDVETLQYQDDPVAQLTLLYRQVQKQLSTYILPLAGQERAYTTHHMDAITGRISGTSAGDDEPDRNMTNITKRRELKRLPSIRGMFIPDDGMFTRLDASQIELRILAHLSQDERMLSIYQSGGDIHADTERAVFGTEGPNRIAAKTFNFAQIYGAKVGTVAHQIGSKDYAKVSKLIQAWREAYSGAAHWITQQQEDGLRQGYVETLLGRKMILPLEMGEEHARNCAVNYPIQGTAAEVFKRVILALSELLPSHRLYVHDELLMNGQHMLPLDDLATVTPVYAPLEVEYQERWK